MRMVHAVLRRLLLWLSAVCLWLSARASASAPAIQETLTVQPRDPHGSENGMKPRQISVHDAAFGQPNYGKKIHGSIVYAQFGCSFQDFSAVVPGKSVAVVRRGRCAFTQKAEMAEAAGAVAVVIGDNAPGGVLKMISDKQAEEEHLGIPAVGAKKVDLDWMVNALRHRHETLEATLSWPFKNQRDTVVWELWAQAYSEEFLDSAKFNSALYRRPMFGIYREMAAALAPAVQFRPRYFMVPGKANQCVELWHNDPQRAHCGRQCANRGRYCTNDPDGDPTEGMDSVDMLQENLRQMCAFKWATKNNKQNRWWRYVKDMGKHCYKALVGHSQSASARSAQLARCSKRIREKVGIGAINQCVVESGGAEFGTATPNTLFDQELKEQLALGVHAAPAITINGNLYVGRMDCGKPLLPSTCPLLRALCAGFTAGSMPAACKEDFWQSPSGAASTQPTMPPTQSQAEIAAAQIAAATAAASEPAVILNDPNSKTSVDCAKLPSECVDNSGRCIVHKGARKHEPPGLNVENQLEFCAQVCGLCGIENKVEKEYEANAQDRKDFPAAVPAQVTDGAPGLVGRESGDEMLMTPDVPSPPSPSRPAYQIDQYSREPTAPGAAQQYQQQQQQPQQHQQQQQQYSTYPAPGPQAQKSLSGSSSFTFQLLLVIAAAGAAFWIWQKAQETGEKMVERMPYQAIPGSEGTSARSEGAGVPVPEI